MLIPARDIFVCEHSEHQTHIGRSPTVSQHSPPPTGPTSAAPGGLCGGSGPVRGGGGVTNKNDKRRTN